MMNNKKSGWRRLAIVFMGLNVFFISGKHLIEKYGFDQEVLIVGNLIVFAATAISFWLANRNLDSTNPHAFVRNVYASIMAKFFICIAAAMIYIFVFKKNVNKPALFVCMGLYVVYTVIEVSALTKLVKEKKNA